MFSISQTAAETVNTLSSIGLILGAVLALTGTLGTVWSAQVISRYADERTQRNERATAEANARAAEASLKAVELERATEGLKRETAAARAESERLKLRILEMQKGRRLKEEQIGALSEYLQSADFRTEPKVNLGIAAVADAEAQIFAMDFMRLFRSCDVDFYPCPSGQHPREITQIQPNDTGLILTVRDLAISQDNQPFTRLQRLMTEIGLPIEVQVSEHLGPRAAQINVLRKPAA